MCWCSRGVGCAHHNNDCRGRLRENRAERDVPAYLPLGTSRPGAPLICAVSHSLDADLRALHVAAHDHERILCPPAGPFRVRVSGRGGDGKHQRGGVPRDGGQIFCHAAYDHADARAVCDHGQCGVHIHADDQGKRLAHVFFSALPSGGVRHPHEPGDRRGHRGVLGPREARPGDAEDVERAAHAGIAAAAEENVQRLGSGWQWRYHHRGVVCCSRGDSERVGEVTQRGLSLRSLRSSGRNRLNGGVNRGIP
mmetsp:Transcript_100199/g.283635  ORF Transcript_100199/g.283635 Transcript_100199/m.283635 type:complete len:252 (+) Transcript_100199:640-1395(+)